MRPVEKELRHDNLSRELVRAAGSVIVTLATAWGPKFGGINSFNAEIVKSLGILPTRDYELICVVPGPVTRELQEDLRLRFHIRLVSLEAEDGEFANGSASEILKRLDVASEPHRFIWIGHDDKSGSLALEMKSLASGSYAILINHMAHSAYQSVKKGNSLSASEKRQRQLDLFCKADLCLAVGPMLRSHLQDLIACVPNSPKIEMLVPGLADPTEYEVEIRDSAPENFVAFIAGRLDQGDDRIKQGRLALRGFGRAVRFAAHESAIRRSPLLRMRGIRAIEEAPLRDLLMQEAGCAVSFDFQDYTEDRVAYFRDLASASVAMMPSWHEGFGLIAWEAIASAVPVVITDECGVYRLLRDNYSGAGLTQSVVHIHVDGWMPSNLDESNHTNEDVDRVGNALLEIAQRMPSAKQQALTLRRNLLDLGLDWKGTALSIVKAIEGNLGVSLSTEPLVGVSVAIQPPVEVDTTVPEFLRLPVAQPWRPNRHLPTSMLLAARDEIVRFDPERENFLAEMRDWALRPNDLSTRILYGPGGVGKTRIARELARRLRQRGWLSIWLSATPPKDWLESWKHILLTRREKPLLFVIDYADARLGEVLAVLSQVLEWLRTSEKPALFRLLLLSRSESLLVSLQDHPDSRQDLSAWLNNSPNSIESLALPLWSKDGTVRLASYRLALDDYATATGMATSPYAFVPCMQDPAFDRPLYLHLAALAALEGQRPYGADALLRDQLRREWCYWRSIYGERVANYDDWSDALAYVIFCQGTDIDQLQRALKMLRVDAPDLAVALQRSYPSGDRIAPLEPDLIADALLRDRLAERRGSALLDAVIGMGKEQIPVALPVIERLIAKSRDSKQDQNAAWAKVLIDGLSSHLPRYNVEWVANEQRGVPTEPTQTTALWALLKPLRRKLDADISGMGTISTLTDRGFGFIKATEPGKDIFFHSKELDGVAYADLKVGDVVIFSIAEGEKGTAAVAISRA